MLTLYRGAGSSDRITFSLVTHSPAFSVLHYLALLRSALGQDPSDISDRAEQCIGQHSRAGSQLADTVPLITQGSVSCDY